MPNFTNIGSSLRRELNEEEEGDEPFYQSFGFSDYSLTNRPFGVQTPDLIIEGEEEESDSEQSHVSEEISEEEGKLFKKSFYFLFHCY